MGMNSQDDFKDRILFAVLSAAAVGLVAHLTERLVATGWHRVTGRAPPRPMGLASFAGRHAGVGAAGVLLRRAPVLNRLQG